jgi:hypothetical protein
MFFYFSTTRSSSWYENQMQENLISLHVHSLRDVSWTWISFFEQMYSMILCTCSSYRTYKKKYIERSEIVKYSKQRQNGANFEHVHCMSVCRAVKKFELENVKFSWKLHHEYVEYTHRRGKALGEGGTCTVSFSSPRAMVPELSANLKDLGKL